MRKKNQNQMLLGLHRWPSLMPAAPTLCLPCSILRTRSLWITFSRPETLYPSFFLFSLCTSSAGPSASVCGSYTSLQSSQNYLSSQRKRKG